MTPYAPVHFIVVSANRGPASPPATHPSVESAEREARRLAILHPDDAFRVYAAVLVVSAPRVVVRHYGEVGLNVNEEEDDLPF